MRHYVRIPADQLVAAKNLASSQGDSTVAYMAGPKAWFLYVEESTARLLLSLIPSATSKTIKVLAPIESAPDAENILTPKKSGS